MSKLSLIAGLGVGYVLGARAGRERYEQLKAGAQKVARDPRVQSAADRAADQARAQTEAAVATAKEKVQDAAQGVGGFTQQATP
ncbi:MAG: hypothetical protein VX494_15620 [Actinomycetota bacterium]|nr:hypothetical protein [Actinomycetota bacterium]MEE3128636.1 hypothetical protein [Actinomycetota bacterium]